MSSATHHATTTDTSDALKSQRVEAARAFASQLLKGIKQIGMYRHDAARFPELLQRAHAAISEYTATHGPLSFKIETGNFALYGQTLFTDDSPLPYKFYRDGIRQLIFRPGLTLDELVAFTLIALSEPERGAEDVVSQLWSGALEHVEYVVVEGFRAMEGAAGEDVEVEVDQVVGYLYDRLRTNSDDFLRFARVSAADLDNQIEQVDQLKGVVVSGRPASDALKATLQRELTEDEEVRLFPKLIQVVVQVMEEGFGAQEVPAFEAILTQILDLLLVQEDYGTIHQLVVKLRSAEKRAGPGSAIERIATEFIGRMGEEVRLTRIAESLKHVRPKNPAEVSRYLRCLDARSVLNFLTALEVIEIPENRQLLLDVLVKYAREQPEPFVHRLQSERSQTVRDMLYVLDRAEHPEKVKMFAQVLRHPSVALRLEALNVLGGGANPEARRYVTEALADEASQVRMLAARLLPEFGRDRAFVDLIKLVREVGFEKRSPEERAALYASIGATGLPQAYSHLDQMLTARANLLNRKRVLEDKLLAIHGLAGAATIQAYQFLQKVVDDPDQPQEVHQAAQRAAYQVKKSLFGESSPPKEG